MPKIYRVRLSILFDRNSTLSLGMSMASTATPSYSQYSSQTPQMALTNSTTAPLVMCTDYLNTSVQIESFYLKEPCLKCECLIFDGVENSLCTHLTHTCPCDTTPCCIAQCDKQPDHSNGTGGTISGGNSNTVRVAILAIVGTLLVVLCGGFLGCYYYRQQSLSDVRTARMLYLDRQRSVKPGASAPIEPPPSYNDIETDGLHDMPPAYNEVVQHSPTASFSFAALLRRDSLGTSSSSPSAPAL